MTVQQVHALREIGKAIIETVKESDPVIGAPGGILYAALMASGCTLNQFQQIMAGLVRAGYLGQSGECYHWVKDL
jgi:hypothetical protein